jgi:hypothetical protein
MGDFSVTPAQFYGIEVKPWAKEIAELVIWIGYLQWWRRRHPNSLPVEPILRDHHNIECRDAVLAYDEKIPLMNDGGEPVDVWDGESMKLHPVTGEEVPDENARRVVYEYVNPRKAEWPEADYVVGNPPFLGAKGMRYGLGDGYVETLRGVYEEVPDSCDYVMYWWERAAELVQDEVIRRFGLITTSSITQQFSARVVGKYLNAKKNALVLPFAIPNHPWIDSKDGADVRIAMTVAQCRESELQEGTLYRVVDEVQYEDGTADVEFLSESGIIRSNLRVGANIGSTVELQANESLSGKGVTLIGAGFVLKPGNVEGFVGEAEGSSVVRSILNGRDVVKQPRGNSVIDFYGYSEQEARTQWPNLYQRLYDQVRPRRLQNKRRSYREKWWVFGEPRSSLRASLAGLERFIATAQTAKHRVFVFLDSTILPDQSLINIASDDAYMLGALSSRIHVVWSLAAGGRLGVGNDPRYNNSICFHHFPFPTATEDQKQEIRELAEELDALRKGQKEKHPKLTLTKMYNVVEKLRDDEPLDEKERKINEQGLVSSHLLPLHDKLDRAVAGAYGWDADLEDEEILQRLVDLNRERAEEEAKGLVRWLRPEFQNPDGVEDEAVQAEIAAVVEEDDEEEVVVVDELTWPKDDMEQLEELRDLIKQKPGLSTEGVQKHFTKGRRKKKRYTQIAEALQAMEAAGVIVQIDEERWF